MMVYVMIIYLGLIPVELDVFTKAQECLDEARVAADVLQTPVWCVPEFRDGVDRS